MYINIAAIIVVAALGVVVYLLRGMESKNYSSFSRVTGVTKRNSDGRKRQKIIKECCKQGDELQLVREPDNPYDEDAVAVHCQGGKIGYLNLISAGEIAPILDEGGEVRCRVSDITVDGRRKSYRVKIQITMA